MQKPSPSPSHSHAHGHSHAPTHGGPASFPLAGFSLLRLSVPQRLALALFQIGTMWLLLAWALVE